LTAVGTALRLSRKRVRERADGRPPPRAHDGGMDDAFRELRPPLSASAAVVEADRCLECGGAHAPAPCVLACPARVDVPRFVAQIASGETGAAAATIFRENLLGASCARVCPVEVLCEGACVLPRDGAEPISIAALQRHATEWALERMLPLRERAEPTGRRVAVVGAGPAGLACAGELAARGHAVTVFDERAEAGGLVRYAIAPYRIQSDPLPAEQRALEALGVRFHLGVVVDGPALRAIANSFDAVFLGVGMGADTPLELPGSHLQGVWRSLELIEAIKTGPRPVLGRRVVVIGGGNTAIDVAREAVRLGADDVTIVYRRTREAMPAYAFEVEEAEAEGVAFEWLCAPVRFVGTRCLAGVELARTQLAEDGRLTRIEGSEFVLPADTAVTAIGQRPRPELAEWLDGLAIEDGTLAVDPESGRTGNPKVFAGGDAVNGGTSAVQAVAEAKRAARAIDEWLR
jgi:glutamate synthase (NADPH/NADH) small chain